MTLALVRNASLLAGVLLLAAAFGLALRYGDPVPPGAPLTVVVKHLAHNAGARHG